MNLCIDCIHYTILRGGMECTHTSNIEKSLVDGKPSAKRSARTMRDYPEMCGKEVVLFVPKPKLVA